MKFKHAVQSTPEIKGAFCSGLQALRKSDKQHITTRNPRRLAGSVDVDTALKTKRANEPRWDYASGYRPVNSRNDLVYWIEVHPGSYGQVTTVLAKLRWLKNWLRAMAPNLNAMPRAFIWLSSGRTSLTLTSPLRKKLALQGLQHKGSFLRIPDNTAA